MEDDAKTTKPIADFERGYQAAKADEKPARPDVIMTGSEFHYAQEQAYMRGYMSAVNRILILFVGAIVVQTFINRITDR